jgi:hypothetical protein
VACFIGRKSRPSYIHQRRIKALLARVWTYLWPRNGGAWFRTENIKEAQRSAARSQQQYSPRTSCGPLSHHLLQGPNLYQGQNTNQLCAFLAAAPQKGKITCKVVGFKCLYVQSSLLQIQRSGFEYRRYQIFWEVVGLEPGPLSLMGTREELLERKSSGFGLEKREYGRRDPSRWPRYTPLTQKLTLTSPPSGGRSVDIVRSRTQATKFVVLMSVLRAKPWPRMGQWAYIFLYS